MTAQPAPIQSLPGRLRLLAGDIKISHTIFAMPWAIFATVMAGRQLERGYPYWGQIALIVLCMILARTVAMAANRLLDAELDAKNPRTARRAIPSGALSRGFYATVAVACAVGFIVTSGGFWFFYGNPWPLTLSVPVLLFISLYPLLKRFTRYCHYYLGAALALAPLCAWIAITGELAWPPLWMAGAVLLWTGGFDIIYACQDTRSDLETGTFSIPAKLGIGPALWVSRATHLGCVIMLVVLGLSSPLLGTLYFTGVVLAAGLLVIEQSLISAQDLSKAGLAFFTMNGIISVALGTLGVIDVLIM